jgi:hypothetical protein
MRCIRVITRSFLLSVIYETKQDGRKMIGHIMCTRISFFFAAVVGNICLQVEVTCARHPSR